VVAPQPGRRCGTRQEQDELDELEAFLADRDDPPLLQVQARARAQLSAAGEPVDRFGVARRTHRDSPGVTSPRQGDVEVITRVRLTLAVLLGAAALPLTTAAALPAPRAPRASLPPTCLDGQLRITRGLRDAGLSHYSTAVLFTNISTRTCTLCGYPGADGLIRGRHDVARRTLSGYLGGAKDVSRVLLHRGGVASAVVEGNTGCAGQGKPVYTGLLT